MTYKGNIYKWFNLLKPSFHLIVHDHRKYCQRLYGNTFHTDILRLRLHCAHTAPGKFENAALFTGFGLPSTLTPVDLVTENGAFRKRRLEWINLKTPARVDKFDNAA